MLFFRVLTRKRRIEEKLLVLDKEYNWPASAGRASLTAAPTGFNWFFEVPFFCFCFFNTIFLFFFKNCFWRCFPWKLVFYVFFDSCAMHGAAETFYFIFEELLFDVFLISRVLTEFVLQNCMWYLFCFLCFFWKLSWRNWHV